MAVEYSTKPSEWRLLELPISNEMKSQASRDFLRDIIKDPDIKDLFPRHAVLTFAPRGVVTDPPPDFSTPSVDVWILGVSPPSPETVAYWEEIYGSES